MSGKTKFHSKEDVKEFLRGYYMNQEASIKLVENTLEVTESMLEAWQTAGGCVRLSELKEMKASQLLEIMALNGIRFVYSRKKGDKNE